MIFDKHVLNLTQVNNQFEHVPLTTPLVLLTLPKAGTHLLGNILSMFVPSEQQDFMLFNQNVNSNSVFDLMEAGEVLSTPRYLWGHFRGSEPYKLALSQSKKILLIRDPYDWVLSMTKFKNFLDRQKGEKILEIVRPHLETLPDGQVEIDKLLAVSKKVHELLALTITGSVNSEGVLITPSMQSIFNNYALSWVNEDDVYKVKYEELKAAVNSLNEGEYPYNYFKGIFDAAGIEMPEDWTQRVLVGANPTVSATSKENTIKHPVSFPDELPDDLKELVDSQHPGLRAALGYE